MSGVEVDYPPRPTRAIYALTRVRKDEVGDGTLVESVIWSLVPCLCVPVGGAEGEEGPVCLCALQTRSV